MGLSSSNFGYSIGHGGRLLCCGGGDYNLRITVRMSHFNIYFIDHYVIGALHVDDYTKAICSICTYVNIDKSMTWSVTGTYHPATATEKDYTVYDIIWNKQPTIHRYCLFAGGSNDGAFNGGFLGAVSFNS